MGIGAVHLNNNIICSVDVEATGLVPGTHEIIQMAVIPLGPDLLPSKHFKTLELRIKPENMSAIDPEARGMNKRLLNDCIAHGMDRWAAVDYFKEWFYKLKLPPNKKIVPLGCNYEKFDLPMIQEFLAGVYSYDEFFRSDCRDVQRLAVSLNDMAEWTSSRIPFPKVNLLYLCSCLHVKNLNPHNALGDAYASAEVYRRMMNFGQSFTCVRTPEFHETFNNLGQQYGNYCKGCFVAGKEADPFHVFRETWEQTWGRIQ